MFLLLSEITSDEGLKVAEQLIDLILAILPIPLTLSLFAFAFKIIGVSRGHSPSPSIEVLPKINKQVLKELPEWKIFETVNINLRKRLKNWDKKTLEAHCPEIKDIINFNFKTFKESTTYLNEFGVSKEVSFIFLQNGQLLQRIDQDLKKQPGGESKVLMQLYIKMAKELAMISKQLEDAMQNHMELLNVNYLNEEKLSKQDYQRIIESRTNMDRPNNTDYDPFHK